MFVLRNQNNPDMCDKAETWRQKEQKELEKQAAVAKSKSSNVVPVPTKQIN